LFVVWQDPRLANTNNDIYGQYIDNTGKILWDTSGLPICNALNQQLTPQLIADGNGGIIVVWSDQRAKVADGNIYAQRVNAAGAIQWVKDGVLICDYTGNQAVPNIVKGGSGYIIAWSDSRKASNDRNIFAQSIDANGTTQWTAPAAGGVPVCQATGAQPINYTNAQNIKILPDGSNGAFFIWDDGRNTIANIDIYGQRITSTGAVSSGWLADGNPITNASKNQQSPGVVLDNTNNVIVSWNDERDSTFNIYASKLSLDGALVLPVNFVTATALLVNNAVQISWRTTNQSFSTNYSIEHSIDGVNFSAIGSSKALGSNTYSFVHNAPYKGNNYYRIHATDKQGTSLYSAVVKVMFSLSNKPVIAAYPNPVFNSLFVTFNQLPKGNYSLRLISSVGKTVKQLNISLDQSTTTQLETASLPKGGYVLQVTNQKGEIVSNQLIIKQ